jgi:hypothetical protein
VQNEGKAMQNAMISEFARYPRRIVSIDLDSFGAVQCIKVAHSFGIYITDEYIPTHNTSEPGRNSFVDDSDDVNALFTFPANFDEAFRLPTPMVDTIETIAEELRCAARGTSRNQSYVPVALPQKTVSEITHGRAVNGWKIPIPSGKMAYIFQNKSRNV